MTMMSKVGIQNRKQIIIEQLTALDDDMILKQVEELMNASIHQSSLKRLTQRKLFNGAKRSGKYIPNGEIYSQYDLDKLSENLKLGQ